MTITTGDSKESATPTPPPLATPPSPSPPEVLPPPRDEESVAVREGDDVTFTLHLAGGEPTDYYWSRNDRRILEDRFHIARKDGHSVQLSLTRVSRDDSGRYTLTASNSSGESRAGYDLRVDSRMSMSDSLSVPTHDDAPHFIRTLADLAVKVGTRTRFLVEIRSPSNLKVTWLRNDRPVKETDRFHFLNEGNFWCVDVGPVMAEDHGGWTCVAENDAGRATCSCQLSVLVPKAYKGPEFLEELRALLTEQGTVSLECKVVGVPTPALRWYKDAKEIRAGDVFALTADASDPTSLGTYTCEAVNCMGRAYSSSRVHVVGRGSREGSLKPADYLLPTGPAPTFDEELRPEKARIGDSLTLSCHVQVPPWPKSIQWYNSDGRVETGDRYRILEDGLGGYSVEISALEACDDGEWKCVATSFEGVRGISTAIVTLTYPKNYRKPRFLESLRAILTEEGLVSFECKVVGFPTPQLRWFKDGQELRPGDVYQLTGTNSLGSYCCIARNCMGEASSTAELTVEDIQSQLSEEERLSLFSSDSVPHFVRGLRSQEARVGDNFRFTVQVSVAPEPSLEWFRDDDPIVEGEKFRVTRENLGTCHLDIRPIDINDQAEWKCVATNEFGHSVTSCFLKLTIPKHFKKPRFLECLRAVLSEEGAVNLECKVIGVPQPVLKWYKDGEELKPGDIHRIISGQDGTCCLGTYTCEATNCMGTVSSSASLVGFEERGSSKSGAGRAPPPIVRDPSLSTIHEERTSQMYDAEQSLSLDERGEVSFSFDGKEVSVSLYETPDLTEEEALQVVEMYADELSEHISEHNVVELPPLRFMKESSTSGNLLMEAVLVDVSPDYFGPAGEEDLRTDADMDEFSITDEALTLHTPMDVSQADEDKSERLDSDEIFDRALEPLAKQGSHKENSPPTRPPRKSRNLADTKSGSKESRSLEEKSDSYSDAKAQSLEMDTSYKSAQENLDQADSSGSRGRDGKASKRKGSDSDETNAKLRKEEKSQLQEKRGAVHTKVQKEGDLTGKDEGTLRRSRTASVDSNSMTEDDTIYDDNIPGQAKDNVKGLPSDQISVIDSLAHSLQRIQNGLLMVESQVVSESLDKNSAKESFKILGNLSQSLQDIQKGLSLIECQVDEEAVVPSGHTEMSILETLAQPLQEFQRKLALIEQQTVLGGTEETLLERTTHSIMECVSQPMQEFQREIGLIHQRAAMGMGEDVVSKKLQNFSVLSGGRSSEEDSKIKVQQKAKSLEEVDLKLKASLSLQTLAEPVTELLNALEKFQADVLQVDEGNILSDKPKLSSLEKLLYPMQVLKAEIELIEQQAILEVDGKVQHGKSLSILEAVSQPMDELRRGIALVEQQAIMESGQEFCSISTLEALEKPIRRLKRGLNQIQQQVSLEASLESIPQSYEISVLQGLEISLHNLKRGLTALQKKCAAEQSEEVFHLFEVCTLFEPIEALAQGVSKASESVMTDTTESGPSPSIGSLDCLAAPLNNLNKSLLQVEETFFPENGPPSSAMQVTVSELVQNSLKTLKAALLTSAKDICVDKSTEEILKPEKTPAIESLVPALQNLEKYLGSLLTQLRRPKETDEVSLAESLETLQSLFKCAYEVENTVSQIRRLAMKRVPLDKTGALVLGSLKDPFHELGTKLIEKQQGLLLQPGDLTMFVKPLDIDLQTLFPQLDSVCEALNDVKVFASLQVPTSLTSAQQFLNLRELDEPIAEITKEVSQIKADVPKSDINSTNYPLLRSLVPPLQRLIATLIHLEGVYTEISGPTGVPSENYLEAMKQTSLTLRSLFELISTIPPQSVEGVPTRQIKETFLNLIQPIAGLEFLIQKLCTDLERDINPTSLHNALTHLSKALSSLSSEMNITSSALEESLTNLRSPQAEIVHTVLSSMCDVQRTVRSAQVQIAMESGEEDLSNTLTPTKFIEISDTLRDLKSNLQSFEISSSLKSKEIVLSHVNAIEDSLSECLRKIGLLPMSAAQIKSPFPDWNTIFLSVHNLEPLFNKFKSVLNVIQTKLSDTSDCDPIFERSITSSMADNLKDIHQHLETISSQVILAQGNVPQSTAIEKFLFSTNELKNHINTIKNVIGSKSIENVIFSSSDISYLCTLQAPFDDFSKSIDVISRFKSESSQGEILLPHLESLQDSVCVLQVTLDSLKSIANTDTPQSLGGQVVFDSLSSPLKKLSNGLSMVCSTGQEMKAVPITILRSSVAQPLTDILSAIEFENERLTHIVNAYVPETDRDIKKSQITLPVEGFKAKIREAQTAILSPIITDNEGQIAALDCLTQCVREFQQLVGAVQSEVAKMCEPTQISDKGSLPLLQNLQQTVQELQMSTATIISVAFLHLENAPEELRSSAQLVKKLVQPFRDFLQSLHKFENVIVTQNDMVPLVKSSAAKSLIEPLSNMKTSLAAIGHELATKPVSQNIEKWQRPIQDLQRGITMIEEEIFLYSDESLTLKDGVSILDTLSQPIQEITKLITEMQAKFLKEAVVPTPELLGPISCLNVLASSSDKVQSTLQSIGEKVPDQKYLPRTLNVVCDAVNSGFSESLQGLGFWTRDILQRVYPGRELKQTDIEVLSKPLGQVAKSLQIIQKTLGDLSPEEQKVAEPIRLSLQELKSTITYVIEQINTENKADISIGNITAHLESMAVPMEDFNYAITELILNARASQNDAKATELINNIDSLATSIRTDLNSINNEGVKEYSKTISKIQTLNRDLKDLSRGDKNILLGLVKSILEMLSVPQSLEDNIEADKFSEIMDNRTKLAAIIPHLQSQAKIDIDDTHQILENLFQCVEHFTDATKNLKGKISKGTTPPVNLQPLKQNVSRSAISAQNEIIRILPLLEYESATALQKICTGMQEIENNLIHPQNTSGMASLQDTGCLQRLITDLCRMEKQVLPSSQRNTLAATALTAAVKQLEWSLKLIYEDMVTPSKPSATDREELLLQTISESLFEFCDQLSKIQCDEQEDSASSATINLLESMSETVNEVRTAISSNDDLPTSVLQYVSDSGVLESVVAMIATPLNALWNGIQQLRNAPQAINSTEQTSNELLAPARDLRDTLIAVSDALTQSEQLSESVSVLQPSVENIRKVVEQIQSSGATETIVKSHNSQEILQALAAPLLQLKDSVATLKTVHCANEIADGINICAKEIQTDILTAKSAMESQSQISPQVSVVSALEGLGKPLQVICDEIYRAKKNFENPPQNVAARETSPHLISAMTELSDCLERVKTQLTNSTEEKALLPPIAKIQSLVQDLHKSNDSDPDTSDLSVLAIVAESLQWLKEETKIVLGNIQSKASMEAALPQKAEKHGEAVVADVETLQPALAQLIRECEDLATSTGDESVRQAVDALTSTIARFDVEVENGSPEERELTEQVKKLKWAIMSVESASVTNTSEEPSPPVEEIVKSINKLEKRLSEVEDSGHTAVDVGTALDIIRTSVNTIKINLTVSDTQREQTAKCLKALQTLANPLSSFSEVLAQSQAPSLENKTQVSAISTALVELKKSVGIAKTDLDTIQKSGMDIAVEFLKPVVEFELCLQTIEEDCMRKAERGDPPETIKETIIRAIIKPVEKFEKLLSKAKETEALKIVAVTHAPLVQEVTDHIESIKTDIAQASGSGNNNPEATRAIQTMQTLESPLQCLIAAITQIEDHTGPYDEAVNKVFKPLHELNKSLAIAMSLVNSAQNSDIEIIKELQKSMTKLQQTTLMTEETAKHAAAAGEKPIIIQDHILENLEPSLRNLRTTIANVKCKILEVTKTTEQDIFQNKHVIDKQAQLNVAAFVENTTQSIQDLEKEIGLAQESVEKGSIQEALTPLLQPLQHFEQGLQLVKQQVQSGSVAEPQKIIVETLQKPMSEIQKGIQEIQAEIKSTSMPDESVQQLMAPLMALQQSIECVVKDTLSKPDDLKIDTVALGTLSEPLETFKEKLQTINKAIELQAAEQNVSAFVENTTQSIQDLEKEIGLAQESVEKGSIQEALTPLLQPLQHFEQGLQLVKQQVQSGSVAEPQKIIVGTLQKPLSGIQKVIQEVLADIKSASFSDETLQELMAPLMALEQSINTVTVMQSHNLPLLGDSFDVFLKDVKNASALSKANKIKKLLIDSNSAVSKVTACTKSDLFVTDRVSPSSVLVIKPLKTLKILNKPLQDFESTMTELINSFGNSGFSNSTKDCIMTGLGSILDAIKVSQAEIKKVNTLDMDNIQLIIGAMESLSNSVAVVFDGLQNEKAKENSEFYKLLEPLPCALNEFSSSLETIQTAMEKTSTKAMAESTLQAVSKLIRIASPSGPKEMQNRKHALEPTVLAPMFDCLKAIETSVQKVKEDASLRDSSTEMAEDYGLVKALSQFRERLSEVEQYLMDQTIESLGELASLVVPLHELQVAIKTLEKDSSHGPKGDKKMQYGVTRKFAEPFAEFVSKALEIKNLEDTAIMAVSDLEHASLVDCAQKSLSDVKSEMCKILSPERDLKSYFDEARVFQELMEPLVELDLAVTGMKEVEKDKNRIDALLRPLENLISCINDVEESFQSKSQERGQVAKILAPLSQLSWSVTFIEENAVLKKEIGENPIVIENTILKSILEPIAEFKKEIDKVKTEIQRKVLSRCDLAERVARIIEDFSDMFHSLQSQGTKYDFATINSHSERLRKDILNARECLLKEVASVAHSGLPKTLKEMVISLETLAKSEFPHEQNYNLLTTSTVQMASSLSTALKKSLKDTQGTKRWDTEDKLLEDIEKSFKDFLLTICELSLRPPVEEASVDDKNRDENRSPVAPETAIARLVSASADLNTELERIEKLNDNKVRKSSVDEIPEKTRATVLATLQEPAKDLQNVMKDVIEVLASHDTVKYSQVQELASQVKKLHQGLEEIEQEVVLEQIKDGAVNLTMLQAIIRPIEQLNTSVALIEEKRILQGTVEESDSSQKGLRLSAVAKPVKDVAECLAVAEETLVQIPSPVQTTSSEHQVLQALANPIQELRTGLAELGDLEQANKRDDIPEEKIEQLLRLAKPIQEIQVAIMAVEPPLDDDEVKHLSPDNVLKALAEPLQVLGHTIAIIEQQQTLDHTGTDFTNGNLPKQSSVVEVVGLEPVEQAVIIDQQALEADGVSIDGSASKELEQAVEKNTSLRAVGVIEQNDPMEAEASLKLQKKRPDTMDVGNASDSLGIAVLADSGVLVSSRRDDTSSELHDEPETLSEIESIPEVSKQDTCKSMEEISDFEDATESKSASGQKQEENAKTVKAELKKEEANKQVEATELDAKKKREPEEKAKVERAKLKREQDAAEKQEKEEDAQLEAQNKKQAEEKAKAEEEKLQTEREAAEQKKKEQEAVKLEAQKKQEAEEKAKAEEEKLKKEQEAADKRNKEEEAAKIEAQKKQEAEEKVKAEEERLKKEQEAAEKKKKEEEAAKLEAKKKQEAEEKAKEEKLKKEQEAADKKKKEEEVAKLEAQKKQEAEEKAKEEKLKKEQEAADKKKKEEEAAKLEAQRKQEADEKAKAEEEKLKKEQEAADKKKKEEEVAKLEAQKKQEAEEKAKAEEERLKKEQEAAEKKKKEEEATQLEAQKKQKAEEKAKEEKIKKEQETAEKKKKEEAAKLEAQKKQEADEKAKIEEENLKKEKEAAEKKKKEEEPAQLEAQKKQKAEDEAKAEEERLKKEREATEKRKKEEEAAKVEAQKKQEADEKTKIEEESLKKEKEAAEKKKKEEEATKLEAKKKQETEEKAKADGEKQRKELEAAEKTKREEEAAKLEAQKKERAEEKAKESKLKKGKDAADKKQDEATQLDARKKKKSEDEAKAEEEKLKIQKEATDKKTPQKEDAGKLEAQKKAVEESSSLESHRKRATDIQANIDGLDTQSALKRSLGETSVAACDYGNRAQRDVRAAMEEDIARRVDFTSNMLQRSRKNLEEDSERRSSARYEEDAARRRKQRQEDAEKFRRDMDQLEERQKRIQEDKKRVDELSSRLMKEEADRRSQHAWGISDDSTVGKLRASISTSLSTPRYTMTRTRTTDTISSLRSSTDEFDVGRGRSRSSSSYLYRPPRDDMPYGKGRSKTPDYYSFTPIRRPDIGSSYLGLSRSTWSSTSALDRRGRSTERALEDLRLGTAHLYEEGRRLARSVTPSPLRGGLSDRWRTSTSYLYEESRTLARSVTPSPMRGGRSSSATTGRYSRLSYEDLHTADSYGYERRSRAMERRLRPTFCARLSDRAVSKGTRVRLACSVLGAPDLRVTWCKDGFPLFSQPNVVTKEVDGLCTLEIPTVEVSDSGVYSCSVRDKNGEATTSCTLTVFGDSSPAPRPPMFIRQISEWYRPSVDELTLETRVSAHPMPRVTWLLNGSPLRVSDRYEQQQLSDGTCRLIIRGPDPASDSGRYTCRAANLVSTDHVAHTINYTGKDKYESQTRSPVPGSSTYIRDNRLPRFASSLVDSQVPVGGTLALQVQVTGYPRPRLEWLLGSDPLPRSSPRYRLLEDGSVHTLMVSGATAKDAGQYTVRAVNPHGSADTSAKVDVVTHGSGGAHGDPAIFLSRPDTLITVAHGEDITVSFRLAGDPKPKVTWMKGTRDITNSGRAMRENVGDYVRLTLKRAILSDGGTYFIVAKNIFGTDRAFFTVQFRQRARSLTPVRHRRSSLGPGDDFWEQSGDWPSTGHLDDASQILRDIHERSKTRREVPGPIAGEPVIADSGRNCVTLTWPKPIHHGDAPVLAYRVEAWRLGSEGGARWGELGISPTNAYDAFGLVAGADYRLRITPRNRHGWGEALVSAPLRVQPGAPTLPEFTRPLAGHIKALRGQDIVIECQVRGDPSPQTRWTLDLDAVEAKEGHIALVREGGLCRLTLTGVREDDAGRYCCEASNSAGRVSTFVRLQVVSDPQLLHADTKLRRDFKGAEIT